MPSGHLGTAARGSNAQDFFFLKQLLALIGLFGNSACICQGKSWEMHQWLASFALGTFALLPVFARKVMEEVAVVLGLPDPVGTLASH